MAKDLIQSKVNPKIELVKLTTIDDSIGSDSVISNIDNRGSEKENSGARQPFVKINNVFISEIEELIIDETGILPTVRITFMDKIGAISGPNFPKHDQIVSVFIKNPTSKFKPIRCDFLITEIKILNDYTDLDISNTVIINGELFIPKLYNNISRSYSNQTSKDALLNISKGSDLGFASNDFTTSDNMTWINTNDSQIDFIKEVTNHSYLDDDSFFQSFIDKYYYLNFIHVPTQLDPNNPIRETYASTIELDQLESKQWVIDEAQKKDFENTKVPLILTNYPSSKKDPNFILNYSLVGEAGRHLKSKGYKRKVYYYDSVLEEDRFTSFYVKPCGIKGTGPNPKAGIEPNNQFLKENEIKKWMGVQYSNVHPEWNASILINDHNNIELNKIKLKVTTPGVNYSVIRGSSISVAIFMSSDKKRIRDSFRNDDSGEDASDVSQNKYETDVLMSGRYYVNGVRYIYDVTEDYQFRTEFDLARTDWYNENNLK